MFHLPCARLHEFCIVHSHSGLRLIVALQTYLPRLYINWSSSSCLFRHYRYDCDWHFILSFDFGTSFNTDQSFRVCCLLFLCYRLAASMKFCRGVLHSVLLCRSLCFSSWKFHSLTKPQFPWARSWIISFLSIRPVVLQSNADFNREE